MTNLLPLREAARRLCVDTRTLRGWAVAGIIGHVTLPNGQVRFREEELEQWIHNRTHYARG